MNPIRAIALSVMLMLAREAAAQGTKADYERAAALRRTTQGKVLRANIEPQWLEGGERFWYPRDMGGGAVQFVLVDATTGAKSPLFDADRLASALETEIGGDVDADQTYVAAVLRERDAGADTDLEHAPAHTLGRLDRFRATRGKDLAEDHVVDRRPAVVRRRHPFGCHSGGGCS